MSRKIIKSIIKNKNKADEQSLPFYRRIGFILAILSACSIVIVGIISVVYMSSSNNRVIDKINTEKSEKAVAAVNYVFDDYTQQSLKAAQSLADEDTIVSGIKRGNLETAKASATQSITLLGLDVDFITLTDVDGNVMARTNSDEVGDSIVNLTNVAAALEGETVSCLDTDNIMSLAICTGAPVLDTAKNIIGTVLTGYSVTDENFVDNVKSVTGNEFSVFLGDECISTTITDNEERAVGLTIGSDIAKTVLEDGEQYIGTDKILGIKYAAAYIPVMDGDGNVIGAYFTGTPLTSINAAVRNATITSVIIELILMALLIALFLYVVRRAIVKPLAGMSDIATQLSHGNLNIEFQYRAKNELGKLADALRLMVYSEQSYIRDISEKLDQMSRGDMRVRVDHDYVGDFAPIKTALEKISGSLNQTLSIINTSADQVNTGAAQVSDASQSLASGVTEQVSTVEELSASISAVADQAEENAENVQHVTEYVKQADAGMNEGNEQMKELTDAMEEIRTASEKISDITKVIEDIAFQTNILALNAAIEAARAGTAGKGFAVVADEVRNLASKSAEAANQTKKLIQNSADTVAEGSRRAERTAQILMDVADSSEMINKSIQQIDVSSSEQLKAIEQIKQGLSQVSSIVQSNAATAEESSASSEELAAQAHMLKDEVSKFKLTDK